ncbi:MAG: hypothetical protein P4M05_24035 [Bradyrhizobium sp.]|nr:hypothetical protein [Bradyrhizobium sp.]
MGYTHDCRPEIFASQPAPVQVNYLGYPGTMGADYIDYIIVDPIVAPIEHADSYGEKLVHLPNCYQPNDRKRTRSPREFNRQECGLPRDAFAFCCFNNQYKITEQMFSLWMDLLRVVPSASAISGARQPSWVFCLIALSLRPIFLQNFIWRVCRWPTCFWTPSPTIRIRHSDALWAGVPVLTCLGETFAGRVAGSLLNAIGLPGLVTRSLAEYSAKRFIYRKIRTSSLPCGRSWRRTG